MERKVLQRDASQAAPSFPRLCQHFESFTEIHSEQFALEQLNSTVSVQEKGRKKTKKTKSYVFLFSFNKHPVTRSY